jgi:twitching motility protein PilT
MARIDSLIYHLFEFGADALGIGAGHQVVLMTEGERRPITAAPMRADEVNALLKDICPADAAMAVATGQDTEFTYAAPSGTVSVKVQLGADGVRMIVSRHAAPAAAAPPPAPPPDDDFQMPKTGGIDLNHPDAAPLRKVVERTASAVPGVPTVGSQEGAPVTTSPPPAARASADDDELDLREHIPEPQKGHSTPLDPYLTALVQKGGSDLYICTGKPALMRRDGDLVQLGDDRRFTHEQALELLFSVASFKTRREWLERKDADFAHAIDGVGRFRGNMFEDRNGIGGIFRQIPSKIPSAEDLGLPPAILQMCTLPKGLVLVTGPTGSGKSTTIAAMIDYINRTQPKHIISIEDPIEFVHEDKRSVINQRQVGTNTRSFKAALVSALREDTDIVLVGELRDLETVEIAIETAETGHLVFGTLHTNTAASTVDRIIDQFPADRQAQIRTMLSEGLKGVVSQNLVKRAGGGRTAAQEILVVTPSVANIIREGKTFQLPSLMQTGKNVGMVTLNDALLQLVKSGTCTPEAALDKAFKQAELRSLFQRSQINV